MSHIDQGKLTEQAKCQADLMLQALRNGEQSMSLLEFITIDMKDSKTPNLDVEKAYLNWMRERKFQGYNQCPVNG